MCVAAALVVAAVVLVVVVLVVVQKLSGRQRSEQLDVHIWQSPRLPIYRLRLSVNSLHTSKSSSL